LTIAAGSRLGPYEIVAPLGAGGMGEVYRARDTRLERTVAIKVLPSHLSASAESRQRFEREAKTISQLSHPHICALHDVGREGDTEYLVMEYLEGETLAERLLKGALPLEQTLRYGIQIADALDKAHRQGIVHRDLKPGNVMLTKSGVKLLDFGLAKVMAPANQQSSLTALPTEMRSLTQEGTILGTFQYMAPEQLEGREADARTDVFAFGCVLYEMATGKKAFSGATQASLISSILRDEPQPVSQVQPMSPRALDHVVQKCLAKDPEDRWQNAADLGSELKWIHEGGSHAGVPAPVVSGGRRRTWLLGSAALLIGALLVWFGYQLRPARPGPVVRSSLGLPAGLQFDGENNAVALSRDGRRLAFAAFETGKRPQLWVRATNSLTVQPIAGTDGASQPFFSWDGEWIGFFADRKLKRVPVAGGTVQTICEAPDPRGGSWGRDGVIVFAPTPFGGLSRVSASGGTPSPATRPENSGITHRLPTFLPDGRRLLFFRGVGTHTTTKDIGIWSLDLETQKTALVARENSAGVWVEPGFLVFVRNGTVMAQRADEKSLRTSGEPVPLAEGIWFNAYRWTGNYSLSDTGVLVFQGGGLAAKSQLTWMDLEGKVLGTVGEPAPNTELALSPDGRRALTSVPEPNGFRSIWMYDLTRGVASRYPTEGTSANFPVWSPDGRQVVYGDGDGNLFAKASDGLSRARALTRVESSNPMATSWSPDGSAIAFAHQESKTGWDIWILPVSGDRKPYPLIATSANEGWAKFSPDGDWLSYVSDESGRQELYVVPFPGPGEKRQVTSGGVDDAFWLGTTGELAYARGGKLFAVRVDRQGIGDPRLLLGGRALRPPAGVASWQPSLTASTRDGKRLLVALPIGEDVTPAMTLVTNWPAELEKR
jgi:eukaryotic-like serine/threonine-protein kinase